MLRCSESTPLAQFYYKLAEYRYHVYRDKCILTWRVSATTPGIFARSGLKCVGTNTLPRQYLSIIALYVDVIYMWGALFVTGLYKVAPSWQQFYTNWNLSRFDSSADGIDLLLCCALSPDSPYWKRNNAEVQRRKSWSLLLHVRKKRRPRKHKTLIPFD